MNIFEQKISSTFAAYCCDTVEFTAGLPSDSVDLSVYSPPFSSLYIYSESERDMGNVGSDDEFQACYQHLVGEILRVTKPGRITAIHVKDLVYYSNASKNGDRGLRDFTGACTTTHTDAGWTYHRKVTIPRDPVREMQKTKSDRLLYKNFKADAARTGGGMPEYIVFFRKWAPNMESTPPVIHRPEEFPLDLWQQWAESVWPNTRETDVLNAKIARDDEAERHLCPMPLDLITRCILQYSNPGETIYSPFMGIGSEGYVSLRHGRRFIGSELKESYFRQAVKNLEEVERLGRSTDMFMRAVA